MIKEINTNEEFDKDILKGKGTVLVDFNADWCGPCKMLKPILEELSSDYSIASVNTDDLDEIAEKYGIMSIPCMIKFTDGKEVSRMIGLHSKEEVEEFLK